MGEEKPTGADVPYIPKGFTERTILKIGSSEDFIVFLYNAGATSALSALQTAPHSVTPKELAWVLHKNFPRVMEAACKELKRTEFPDCEPPNIEELFQKKSERDDEAC